MRFFCLPDYQVNVSWKNLQPLAAVFFCPIIAAIFRSKALNLTFKVTNPVWRRYTLNDLERLTGIKADTLRMWEQRYQVTAPHRTATNRRWYTGDDLRKLINISILNRNGLKISEISSMPLQISGRQDC